MLQWKKSYALFEIELVFIYTFGELQLTKVGCFVKPHILSLVLRAPCLASTKMCLPTMSVRGYGSLMLEKRISTLSQNQIVRDNGLFDFVSVSSKVIPSFFVSFLKCFFRAKTLTDWSCWSSLPISFPLDNHVVDASWSKIATLP